MESGESKEQIFVLLRSLLGSTMKTGAFLPPLANALSQHCQESPTRFMNFENLENDEDLFGNRLNWKMSSDSFSQFSCLFPRVS